jgi:nitrite reductase/ring-hydroxylating ferredoxin subunit
LSAQQYQTVALKADLPRGRTLRVEVDKREILLCHTAEGIFAIDNLCTHAAARLCEGKLKGNRILCPLHGAAFDVRDGSALSRPASVALKCYPVEIRGEEITLLLTPTAED